MGADGKLTSNLPSRVIYGFRFDRLFLITAVGDEGGARGPAGREEGDGDLVEAFGGRPEAQAGEVVGRRGGRGGGRPHRPRCVGREEETAEESLTWATIAQFAWHTLFAGGTYLSEL